MGMSGDRSRYFNIVAETRRVRTDEEKRAIVAEASRGYRNVSAVRAAMASSQAYSSDGRSRFPVPPCRNPLLYVVPHQG